jgi:hypothetical protein
MFYVKHKGKRGKRSQREDGPQALSVRSSIDSKALEKRLRINRSLARPIQNSV